jgi:hypothetical protein
LTGGTAPPRADSANSKNVSMIEIISFVIALEPDPWPPELPLCEPPFPPLPLLPPLPFPPLPPLPFPLLAVEVAALAADVVTESAAVVTAADVVTESAAVVTATEVCVAAPPLPAVLSATSGPAETAAAALKMSVR